MKIIRIIFFCALMSTLAATSCTKDESADDAVHSPVEQGMSLRVDVVWATDPPASGTGYYSMVEGVADDPVRIEMWVTMDRTMTLYLHTKRIEADTEPLIRIFSPEGTQIVRHIELKPYFEWLGVNLAEEEQVFEIAVEVRGEKIALSPREQATGWDDGGYI